MSMLPRAHDRGVNGRSGAEYLSYHTALACSSFCRIAADALAILRREVGIVPNAAPHYLADQGRSIELWDPELGNQEGLLAIGIGTRHRTGRGTGSGAARVAGAADQPQFAWCG